MLSEVKILKLYLNDLDKITPYLLSDFRKHMGLFNF